MGVGAASNFGFLARHDAELARLGADAERFFRRAPDVALVRLRQLGELVPQDPNDEPASVLLERMRAEREPANGASETPTKRGRKATRAEAAAPRRRQ